MSYKVSASLQKLLTATRAKQIGPNHWVGYAITRNERTPSVHITLRENGPILINDFGGSGSDEDKEEILKQAGLRFSDLFPERLPGHHYPPQKLPRPVIDYAEMLNSLHIEAIYLLIMSRFFVSGERIRPEAQERLQTACKRIGNAVQLIKGARR